jgi:hypothetical protein
MMLNSLATALQKTRDAGLFPVDVIIMNMVVSRGDRVPVMDVVKNCTHSSPATVHARIKLLVEIEVLKKVESASDLRLKYLEKGGQFDSMVQSLTN